MTGLSSATSLNDPGDSLGLLRVDAFTGSTKPAEPEAGTEAGQAWKSECEAYSQQNHQRTQIAACTGLHTQGAKFAKSSMHLQPLLSQRRSSLPQELV